MCDQVNPFKTTFIHSNHFILVKVKVNLEQIPANQEAEAQSITGLYINSKNVLNMGKNNFFSFSINQIRFFSLLVSSFEFSYSIRRPCLMFMF